MKKLLLLPLLLLLGLGANAQCTAAFTAAANAQNNNLLQWNFTLSNSYGTYAGNPSHTSTLYFGDGTTSSFVAGAFNHNYSSAGTYTVGLRIRTIDSVSGNVLCTDSTHQTITVGYTPCGSSFTTTGTGNQRTFTATTPGTTGTMAYSWNFGDGSPAGTGSPVTHAYTTTGAYTITLTAIGGGCTYTNTQTIYVTAPVTLNCANLHAAFSSSVSSNVAAFTNTSTSVASPFIRSSNWNFGDGSSPSFATSPSHTYAATGTYSVKLITVWHDSAYSSYCSDTITHNVTIASIPPPPNYIQGYIQWDSTNTSIAIDSFKVYLIQFNSITNMLSATDSLTTAGYYYALYQFNNPPAGNYLVKAASLTAQPGNTGNLPTYHDSSLYWNTAQTIVHAGGITAGKSIWMKQGITTSGPGFVAGNVSLGANKGANNGVAGMNVYLRNTAGKAIKNAVTDANGNFNFYSVPAGTYSIYPENLNYATTPATSVAVTNGTPTVSGINFNQDNTQHNIKPRNTTGITNLAGNNVVITISPNPAHGAITIAWSGADAKGAHFIITNITGSIVMDKAITGNGIETLNVSGLQPGLYFLHGTEGLLGKAQKLVIE